MASTITQKSELNRKYVIFVRKYMPKVQYVSHDIFESCCIHLKDHGGACYLSKTIQPVFYGFLANEKSYDKKSYELVATCVFLLKSHEKYLLHIFFYLPCTFTDA